jgi:hypothetical protein
MTSTSDDTLSFTASEAPQDVAPAGARASFRGRAGSVRHTAPIARGTATIVLALLVGCTWAGKGAPAPKSDQPGHVPSGSAEPRSANGSARTFVSSPVGASVAYPLDWRAVSNRDVRLMLLPANHPTRAGVNPKLRWGEHFISLDVPELPAFRIPGFLPMDRIRGGYIDDLRKQASGAKVEDLEAPPIPDAKTALVRATWPEGHPTHVETALLLTHDDRVYILRARSRTEDEPATRAAFDHVMRSLRWLE